LIRIKAVVRIAGHPALLRPKERPMPTGTMIAIFLILLGFAAFATTLFWGERQTRNITR
jgi:uncharacterized membrane protein HdeD (DUF308 family)